MTSTGIDRRELLKLIGGALVSVPLSAMAQRVSPSSTLTSRLKLFVLERQIAGAVALVSQAGGIVYLEAVGEQDHEAHNPMSTATIFDMRSMTKTITATAIMCLVEDKMLKLDDRVSNYVPEFTSVRVKASEGVLRPPSRPITLLDLLTHTSGMGEGRPKEIENITRVLDHSLEDVAKIMATQPLEADPGAPWKYASGGYAVLGRVVEVRSGRPYQDFVVERILKPLKMHDSFFFPPREKWRRIAAMYNMEQGHLRRDSLDIYRKGAVYPAPEFGLYSTAHDMERFMRMMLQYGSMDGKRVLSERSVHAMLKPRVPTAIGGVAQGLAWFVCVDPDKQRELRISRGSFGAAGASGTFGWIDPDQQMVRLLLVQRFGGDSTVRDSFMSLAADCLTK